jgi:hypothetical protein
LIAWRRVPGGFLVLSIGRRWRPIRAFVGDGHRLVVRAVFAEEFLAEAAPFLVARDFEAGPGILVRPARTPRRAAAIAWRTALAVRRARFFLRLPEASSREPHQHGIWMLGLQLPQRRQQLVRRMRAEGRGLALEDDRPVRVAGRHLKSCSVLSVLSAARVVRGSRRLGVVR